MTTKPVCTRCKRSGTGVNFPIFPKTQGFMFGDICDKCDEQKPCLFCGEWCFDGEGCDEYNVEKQCSCGDRLAPCGTHVETDKTNPCADCAKLLEVG